MRGIYRSPVNSPHKWPIMRKCFQLMTSSWSLKITDLRLQSHLPGVTELKEDHTGIMPGIFFTKNRPKLGSQNRKWRICYENFFSKYLHVNVPNTKAETENAVILTKFSSMSKCQISVCTASDEIENFIIITIFPFQVSSKMKLYKNKTHTINFIVCGCVTGC